MKQWILAAVLAALPVLAAGDEILTLQEAFARALAANPRVERARTEVEVAEARRRQALALVFPKISASGQLTRNLEEASFGSGDDRRVLLPENDWAYTFSLRQPIFAGMRERRAYQQSKVAIEQAEYGLEEARNRILLEVGTDYLTVLEAQTLTAVEERNLELARRRLTQATDFFEVGEVTRVDVLRAEAGIKAAERQLVTAQAQRSAAAGNLRVSLALDDATAGDLAGDLAVAPAGDFLPPLPAEDELIRRATAASPAVRQAQLAVTVADLEIKKRKGAYLPVISAEGGWVEQRSSFPLDSYGFFSLNFEVPIFQGGEVRSRVREARGQQRQAELQLEDLERSLREQVRRALLDVTTARTLLELAREELAAAEREYEESFELYRAQEASALDLEAAELGLADARRRVASAEVALQQAQLAVWYVSGDLEGAVLPNSQEEDPS